MVLSGGENKKIFVQNGHVEERSELSIELEIAKETIAELQRKLSGRENELRIAKDKQQENFRRQSRRRKISAACFFNPNNTSPAKSPPITTGTNFL